MTAWEDFRYPFKLVKGLMTKETEVHLMRGSVVLPFQKIEDSN